ncbi:probable inactive nicotinamidase At3g16190 [Henckelia pumila]|uniref:probable inactive nicotinamidase At3g16190 n=1 Tax=Henckelia pumila TaxID=405737 RepID=UPI003C6E1464
MNDAETKWKSTALLVIGMQKDFILPSSPVHLRGAEAIVPNVVKAVEVARSRGVHIIWVVREHDSSGRDAELFRRHLYSDDKPKPVCKGTIGAEILDELVVQECDYKLVKTRFSAFFNTNLDSYLKGLGVDNLVIIGIQTPNCIRQTTFDAVCYDYPIVAVIIDATAAATLDIHQANIFDMKKIKVATPTLEEWCAE